MDGCLLGFRILIPSRAGMSVSCECYLLSGRGLSKPERWRGLGPQGLKVKVKRTLVQALRLCTGRTAHRRSRVITLPFHDHGTRSGWGVSVTPRPLFSPGKDPALIFQDVGWAPGPVWTGAENLAPTGIRSPNRQARSQSLYRLRYPYGGYRALKKIVICGLQNADTVPALYSKDIPL